MYSSNQELLYIVLSLCIVWFTVFLCWFLYQAARVLKNANDILEDLMQKIELITDAVHFIKEKVDALSRSMGTVNGLLATVVEKYVVGAISKKLQGVQENKKAPTCGRGPDSDIGTRKQ